MTTTKPMELLFFCTYQAIKQIKVKKKVTIALQEEWLCKKKKWKRKTHLICGNTVQTKLSTFCRSSVSILSSSFFLASSFSILLEFLDAAEATLSLFDRCIFLGSNQIDSVLYQVSKQGKQNTQTYKTTSFVFSPLYLSLSLFLWL